MLDHYWTHSLPANSYKLIHVRELCYEWPENWTMNKREYLRVCGLHRTMALTSYMSHNPNSQTTLKQLFPPLDLKKWCCETSAGAITVFSISPVNFLFIFTGKISTKPHYGISSRCRSDNSSCSATWCAHNSGASVRPRKELSRICQVKRRHVNRYTTSGCTQGVHVATESKSKSYEPITLRLLRLASGSGSVPEGRGTIENLKHHHYGRSSTYWYALANVNHFRGINSLTIFFQRMERTPHDIIREHENIQRQRIRLKYWQSRVYHQQ